jgi:hypothetical protein
MNHPILEQLDTAQRALRENLHRHDLEPTARQHMERALSHVREAHIATNQIGRARSVHRLVSDLEKVDRLLERFRAHQPTGVTVKPIRI